ncbi:MAG: hypothetical protein BBJ57_03325 [Desulfobacterales bacterium PC51MH44]|nr:MAG: hypothetical protein BBJ57_03325 [Desulfobacterales bacterium PC51MH44]
MEMLYLLSYNDFLGIKMGMSTQPARSPNRVAGGFSPPGPHTTPQAGLPQGHFRWGAHRAVHQGGIRGIGDRPRLSVILLLLFFLSRPAFLHWFGQDPDRLNGDLTSQLFRPAHCNRSLTSDTRKGVQQYRHGPDSVRCTADMPVDTPPVGGAAGKAANLMGCKSPAASYPIRAASISDAREGNNSCSART